MDSRVVCVAPLCDAMLGVNNCQKGQKSDCNVQLHSSKFFHSLFPGNQLLNCCIMRRSSLNLYQILISFFRNDMKNNEIFLSLNLDSDKIFMTNIAELFTTDIIKSFQQQCKYLACHYITVTSQTIRSMSSKP